MKALNRKLFRDVVSLRGPLLSIALVVAAGVMSAITMQSTYRSLEVALDYYFQTYRFAHVFTALKRAPEWMAERVAEIPGVAAVETRVSVDVPLTIAGLPRSATGHIVSVPERRRPMLNDLHLRHGRWVAPGRDDEAMVSERFAEANGLIVGDTLVAVLNGRRRTLHIAGIALSPEFVYEVAPASGFLADEKLFGVLWMRRGAVAAVKNMEGAFNDLVLRLAPGASEHAVIERVDDLLLPFGGLGAYGRTDHISTRIISDEIRQNRASATVVPVVFLGVAAFLLHIVLMRLVTTQREQIALLKAFGYPDSTVALHYLALACVAVGAGAVTGLLAGAWLGSAYTSMYGDYFKFPVLEYRMHTEVAVGAVLISAAAAFAGAIAAARAVLRLQPAVGMRAEAPATFRPLLVERWGLHRWFTAAQRMVLRNVERRPVRACLSAIGVGFSLSVFLIGLVLLDSMRSMIDTQFDVIQQEDATLSFTGVRDARAIRELRRVPGVLVAEPYRAVSVELRSGHVERRLAITGLPVDGRLRRIVDGDGNLHYMPEGGVLLTRKLAEVLRVRRGDTLSAELLDRGGERRTLVVAAVVDEMVGINAYMALPDLNRLLREVPSVSGANLVLMRGQEAGVFSHLSDLPDIGSTASKKALVESFESQMAESLYISMLIIIILASVLGVGVIYNGARIALSERGRELAALRVLGFTRGEVASMLLGEQAVVTLAGLPIGALMGYGVSALIAGAYDTELYRMPLMFKGATVLGSAGVICLVAAAAGLLVRRRLDRADLIAVLKSRE